MTFALTTQAITKAFGKRPPSVHRLSLHVERGSIYGFLGANGAGKTTTLKIILRLLRPDTGSVLFFGKPLTNTGGYIGSLIETPSFYGHLTAYENLEISRLLLCLPATEIGRVLEIVELQEERNERVGTFSLGMKQRLGIARALLGSPKVIILDEPLNGLDPAGVHTMRSVLCRLVEEGDHTLLVSSHLLSELERVVSHVGLIHNGKLLLECTLAQAVGCEYVEFETDNQNAAIHSLQMFGKHVCRSNGEDSIATVKNSDPADIAAILVGQNLKLKYLSKRQQTLEQVYLQHIAQHKNQDQSCY